MLNFILHHCPAPRKPDFPGLSPCRGRLVPRPACGFSRSAVEWGWHHTKNETGGLSNEKADFPDPCADPGPVPGLRGPGQRRALRGGEPLAGFGGGQRHPGAEPGVGEALLRGGGVLPGAGRASGPQLPHGAALLGRGRRGAQRRPLPGDARRLPDAQLDPGMALERRPGDLGHGRPQLLLRLQLRLRPAAQRQK